MDEAGPGVNEEDVMDLKDYLDNELSGEEEKNTDSVEKEEENEELGVEDIESRLIDFDIDENVHDVKKEMLKTVEEVDKQTWKQGKGFRSGYSMLDEKMDGIQPGFAIIGADSNVGKSSFLLNLGFKTAVNDDCYAVYYSFDDDASNLLPRVVAMRQTIPINAIRIPEDYLEYPAILKRRKKGLKELYNMADKFKLIDDEDTRNIEILEKSIKRHKKYAEERDKGLFVLVDSFHDIKSKERSFSDNNEKYEYIADILETCAKKQGVPIWCTAELKKLDAYRRPILDDVRHSSRIKFKSKLMLLLHNEVSQKDDPNASVYYRNEDRPGKSPVIEVDFAKNKLSSYKGRLYYNFIPEYASIIEADEEEKEQYDTMVHQDDE